MIRILEENWDQLADMLRREIEGYGRLFGLLEEQRESLLHNNLESLVETNVRMEAHTDELDHWRRERESLVRGLFREVEGASGQNPTVKGLVRHSPEATQPLFEELLSEVNRLIGESRRKLERNQMLLRRSRDIGRRFLDMINPEPAPGGLYARNGQSRTKSTQNVAGHYRAHA
jgi:flagellar biosynthesis/type III secretory pathway chaperone